MHNHVTNFLLVDDDANDIFLVELEFKKAPLHHLQVVRDGVDAKDYLDGAGEFSDRKKFPMPDVILLDLKMPRWGGFKFLEWKHSDPRPAVRLTPTIILSSSALKADVDRAYALGANSYMVKPIKWVAFQERIHALGMYWANHVEKPQHPS